MIDFIAPSIRNNILDLAKLVLAMCTVCTAVALAAYAAFGDKPPVPASRAVVVTADIPGCTVYRIWDAERKRSAYVAVCNR